MKTHPRWFYPVATLALLVLTIIGFQLFYFEGKAYPGRPLPPPIRTLLIVHGVAMSAWMLVAVLQPLLVAAGNRALHRRIGTGAAVLAVALVVVGIQVSIESIRITPPDLARFGLLPKPFMMVPLWSIAAFGLFLFLGVAMRRRPEAHRAMMFLASLAAVAAATGRFGIINGLLAGTWLEHVLSAFVIIVAFGVVVLAVRWAVTRRFDRWLGFGLAGFAAGSVLATSFARTPAWDRIATALLG
jgi:hypothetical protein